MCSVIPRQDLEQMAQEQDAELTRLAVLAETESQRHQMLRCLNTMFTYLKLLFSNHFILYVMCTRYSVNACYHKP